MEVKLTESKLGHLAKFMMAMSVLICSLSFLFLAVAGETKATEIAYYVGFTVGVVGFLIHFRLFMREKRETDFKK